MKGNSEYNYSNFKGREVLRTINESDFNMNNWISTIDSDSNTIECPVCISYVPFDNIFVLSCNDDHKICYNCLYQHSLNRLNENSALICPILNCDEIIPSTELNWFPFPKHIVRKLVERYDEFLVKNYINKYGIKCPNSNCHWVTFIDTKLAYPLECGHCKLKFCSVCRCIAHYRTDCNDNSILLENWMNWCITGRCDRQIENNRIRKQDSDNRKVEERNQLLRQNWDNLRKDENFKSERCKLCPKCKRVVEK